MSVPSTTTNGAATASNAVDAFIRKLKGGYAPARSEDSYPGAFFQPGNLGVELEPGVYDDTDMRVVYGVIDNPPRDKLEEITQAISHLPDDKKSLSIILQLQVSKELLENLARPMNDLMEQLCARLALWKDVFLVVPETACNVLAKALDEKLKEFNNGAPYLKSLCLYPSQFPTEIPALQDVSKKLLELSPCLENFFHTFSPPALGTTLTEESLAYLGNGKSLKFLCILKPSPWRLNYYALKATNNNLHHMVFFTNTRVDIGDVEPIELVPPITMSLLTLENLKTLNITIEQSNERSWEGLYIMPQILQSLCLPRLECMSLNWHGTAFDNIPPQMTMPLYFESGDFASDIADEIRNTVDNEDKRCRVVLSHFDDQFEHHLRSTLTSVIAKPDGTWEDIVV